MNPILQRFSALLLDLNGTFMFGHDRFGGHEDYGATYRRLGGCRLDDRILRRTIDACFAELDQRYTDSAYYECFPSVSEVLGELTESSALPSEELILVESVIASHEAGQIAEEYAHLLRRLAGTHQLGLVSNIWSNKQPYVAELARSGVLEVLDTVVFSSDGSQMKPSRVLFDRAMAGLGVLPEEVVVIGDSLRCDVGGARAAGLASIWIDPQGKGIGPGDPQPTWIIRDLLDLDTDAP